MVLFILIDTNGQTSLGIHWLLTRSCDSIFLFLYIPTGSCLFLTYAHERRNRKRIIWVLRRRGQEFASKIWGDSEGIGFKNLRTLRSENANRNLGIGITVPEKRKRESPTRNPRSSYAEVCCWCSWYVVLLSTADNFKNINQSESKTMNWHSSSSRPRG